jgi:NADH-quinone oxidoreductase subunit C
MSGEKSRSVPASLPFLFTPVVATDETDATENPLARKTTSQTDVAAALRETFPDDVLQVDEYAGEVSVLVDAEKIVEICRFLKSEKGFDYLADLGGLDRFTDSGRYEIFYNLVSISEARRIRIRTLIDEESMLARSLTGIFRAADWNERECYDMFGIRFENHPDMRRIFMPEDFEYHPLRKEFPLLGVPGSLPLPPQSPEADLTRDPYAAAHGSKPVKSFEEEKSNA